MIVRVHSAIVLLCTLALPVALRGQTTRLAISREPGTVTILRDDWGVPHLYASREEDGYFGLGYAMAEDRLESVLRRYLAVTGRLSSAFGADSLDKDLSRLRWMHLETARASFPRLSPAVQQDYRMFVAGIQRFISEHPGAAPAWTPPLEAAMPIAWSRAWINDWSEGADECARGGAPVPRALLVGARADERPLAASNAWALSPWRTADGAAILMGDSHSAFTGNGEMFEFHLSAGTIEVTGTGGVGTGWVIVGHTRAVAWTTTNRSYDAADCYEIRVDSANPRRYLVNGQWRDMTTRTVTVPVKGGTPATRTFEYADHNGVLAPVVARQGMRAWIVTSAYMDRAMLDEQMHRQLLARDVHELLDAQRMLEMWPTNLMAADSAGNIMYLRTGRVPVRSRGPDWARPLDATTSATAWRGIHPLEDLVQLVNPSSGYMQNDNVSPDVMFEGSPLTPDRYAPEVFADRPGNTNFRGERTKDVLSRSFHATAKDMLALLFDEKWEQARLWSDALRGALNRSPAWVARQSPVYRVLAQRIAGFDGFAHKESRAALSYLFWRRALSEHGDVNRAMVAMAFRDSVPGAAYDSAMLAAVDRARVLMSSELGSSDLAFGDVYRVGRGGLSLPLGGFVGTMRAMVYSDADTAGRHWVVSGQRQPLLVMFTRPVRSYSSLNFGQSNNPTSPHYADQSRLMSEQRLKPTWFNESELRAHISSRRVLRVELNHK
jgi:acyl-homoserine lactone acylase PvdQ